MNKSYVALLGLTLVAFGATGCKKDNPLKNYVEETVKLKSVSQVSPSQLVVSGDLTFRHTHYWTAYRTECDTQICGYDNIYRCHPYTHCEPDHDLDGDDHHGGDGDHHGGGGGHYPPGGGGGGAHYPPGGGHGGGPGHGPRVMSEAEVQDVIASGTQGACYTRDVCGYESVPRYCQVNCRQVPYTESNTVKIESPVAVRVTLAGGAAIRQDAIQSLQIGVKPTGKFVEAFNNPSMRPKHYEYLFDSLHPADRTLVVLAGNGIRLANDQNFLVLPPNFRAGDPVSIELQLVPGGGQNQVSAVGTAADFPVLNTSDWGN
jgi:hypothetical protein